MYKDFFALKESPFTIVPSARFLFLSERHREALNHMLSGLGDGGGFALLTGEVGTGKTTVLRALIARLEESTEVAILMNPSLSALELLASICDEFQLTYPTDPSLKQLTDALYEKLKRNDAAGRQTVLIIDEAQHLMPDVLEQLRLLTNLETDSRKLLKVVLIGQPELQRLLQQDNLRQLAQRITSRYHLLPLTEAEVTHYIQYRLQTVGCLNDVFNPKAMTVVAKRTLGIPRLINVVCDKAMLIACQKGQRMVTPDIVSTACEQVLDWQTASVEPVRERPVLPVMLAVGVALLATGWGIYHWMPQWAADTAFSTPAQSAVVLTEGSSVETPILPVNIAVVETPLPAIPETPAMAYPDDIWSLRGEPRHALQVLGQLWGVALTYPQSSCQMLESAAVQCYTAQVTLAQLRMIDKPAVLTLASQQQRLSALLYALDDSQAELLIDGYRIAVSYQWLEKYWTGDAVWLWKPPFSDTVILPGQRGEPVQWLDQRLALVLGVRSLQTDSLNSAMRERVARFQRNQLLQADGIPGPMTLMSLQSALRLSGPDLMPVGRQIERISANYQFAPYPLIDAGEPLLLTQATASQLSKLPTPSSDAPVAIAQAESSSLDTLDLSELSPELAQLVETALNETTSAPIAKQDGSLQSETEAVPIGQLPASVQQRIPALNFQTHIYASTAKARWVKVNNRELFEGDEAAPGLVIAEIAPNHVEMTFENYRFEIPALSEW
ncbi:AAA family ATPase [Thaumasiovibrio sp. DFM-14]|uniref:AAA family ATPase n=1 Tax=Thaumasiovibrio sp. DFM-14 TaxID=3384792 RepID=UPI00399F7013